jgi:hypothetical protein
MATLGSSASLTQTDYEDGTVFERTSSLFSHRPIRMKSATAFYAAFCPCFAEVECWPTGIPNEPCQSRFRREPVWPVLNEPEGWPAIAGTRMRRLLQSTWINGVVNDDAECSAPVELAEIQNSLFSKWDIRET